MGFDKKPLENGRKRLLCPTCQGETFIIEYGPVMRPVKGGHKKRYIGRCLKCEPQGTRVSEHHISYGHSN